MRRAFIAFLLSLVIFSGPATAAACPMCKEANEADDNRPKAYMYSILFMMGMPAVLFTGFGLSMYRAYRKQQRADEELFGPLGSAFDGDDQQDKSSSAEPLA